MTTLEQVTQLKNQGFQDDQIISTLQQQGVSPNEINNALSQAEIKNAVAGAPAEAPAPMPDQQVPGAAQPATQEYAPQEGYAQQPATQEYATQDEYAPQEAAPGNYQQQEYYPQEGYDQGVGGFDSNTIMEISEQVFSEKIKKIENQLTDLKENKALSQNRIDNIEERLKKIESVIDKLQITILEKVGSYGQNLDNIKKEMSMMQDSFGKMVNPLVKKATQKTTPVKKVVRKKVA